ncbi:MAPEG family protein [Bradyrhizobium sp.]|uniref:MAPEG family protein n=1 Tax=Bradyrhizobium sp. TaxID=376 RepID=UPI0027309C42|nr:MAPEG family protein [Bradyrhizobium sp.]MDP1868516.1 MAPEG family protein [Bradyrhizobium sp.]MDP3074856.1 MAPEG family protein [Bradyrhizobium sp.]
MQLPSITAAYLGILALLYLVLGLQVSRLRRGHRVLFGDGDNIKLRSAIRAHGNFVEYVPIIVLMVTMLEMSGTPAATVHLLMGELLVARLLHPLGMYVGPRTLQFQICRVGGILLTLLVLLAAAVLLLWRFLPTLI